MTRIRFAATAFIVATSLASVAFAQQPPKPATAPQPPSSDATAEVGTEKFAMYTQNDGAWIKNVAEEPRMVDAMRKGADLTVQGTSGRGTTSTDQYSLKGLAQALDKIEQECK
jgi:hypothetical protein